MEALFRQGRHRGSGRVFLQIGGSVCVGVFVAGEKKR